MDADDGIDWGSPPPSLGLIVSVHADPAASSASDDPPRPMDKRRVQYSEFGEAPLLLCEPPPVPPVATACDFDGCYNDDYMEDEDEEAEKNFMATKPWLGAIYPPKRFIRDEDNPHKVYDENYNNWDPPPVTFKLDFVMGYRARDIRENLHWVDFDTCVFCAAAVGIVLDIKTRDQFFYFGHTNDIVSLDLHRDRKLVASGSLGPRWDCQLCIWSIENQSSITEKQNITKILQFGIVSVNFNPSGTLVCCLGLDEHHSLAIVDVDSGLLLCRSDVDKNRVLQAKFARSLNVDSETHMVTIGVSHICFWKPSDACGGNPSASSAAAGLPDGRKLTVYQTSDAEIDRKLFFEKGNTTFHPVDKACAISLEFTSYHTLVGLTDGCVLMFDTGSHDLMRTLNVTAHSLKELGPNATAIEVSHLSVFCIVKLWGEENETCSKGSSAAVDQVAIGTAEGLVYFYGITASSAKDFEVDPKANVTADGEAINLSMLDSRTANDNPHLVNCARSMCWEPTLNQLLIGTSLTTIYIVDVRKSMAKKPVFRVMQSGHYGDIMDPHMYGELWGIDVHPFKQVIITCCDDCTVRMWELVESNEVARFDVGRKAYKCSYSGDGSLVAVAFLSGGFCILDGNIQRAYLPFRKDSPGQSTDISFSPNGQYLALGIGNIIDVYELICEGRKQDPNTKTITYSAVSVKHLGECTGHTCQIDAFDWNLSSTLIQCCSIGYEILYFEIPSTDQVTGVKAIAEELWYTQTCTLGWAVQGIWPRYADGTDVNACGKSRSENYLTTVDDYGLVKLYNYPCVGSGLDRKTGKLNVRPKCHEFRGHSSHVTNTAWTFDDTYCITTGGADLSIFVWKVDYGSYPKPKFFLNAERMAKIRPDPVLGLVEITEDELAESIMRKEAKPPVLPRCYMCDYGYTREVETQCPRCFASRALPQPKLRKAWRGKEKFLNSHPTSDFQRFIREQRRLMREERLLKKGGVSTESVHASQSMNMKTPGEEETEKVASRYTQPTQAFARLTKIQQQKRREVETAPRLEGTWKGGSVRQGQVGSVGSDSDEEEIAKKVKEASALQRKKEQAAAAKTAQKEGQPPPKTKKTSGPDYRDY